MSLEALLELLGSVENASAHDLAGNFDKRALKAVEVADRMNNVVNTLIQRWHATSVGKAKAAGDALRTYGDTQHATARQIRSPLDNGASLVWVTAQQSRALAMPNQVWPESIPPDGPDSGTLPTAEEDQARYEQEKEARRQEAIQLGRRLDLAAQDADAYTPQFTKPPTIFATDHPTPKNRSGGGGQRPDQDGAGLSPLEPYRGIDDPGSPDFPRPNPSDPIEPYRPGPDHSGVPDDPRHFPGAFTQSPQPSQVAQQYAPGYLGPGGGSGGTDWGRTAAGTPSGGAGGPGGVGGFGPLAGSGGPGPGGRGSPRTRPGVSRSPGRQPGGHGASGRGNAGATAKPSDLGSGVKPDEDREHTRKVPLDGGDLFGNDRVVPPAVIETSPDYDGD